MIGTRSIAELAMIGLILGIPCDALRAEDIAGQPLASIPSDTPGVHIDILSIKPLRV